MKKQAFTRFLANDDFEDLFIELGWNDYNGDKLLYPAEVEGKTFNFYVVAHQSGFMVLKCAVDWLPTMALYKKLDSQIRKSAREYLCIYYIPGEMKQMWIVPVDKVDKRDLVSVKYVDEAHAEFLYDKIDGFTFPLGEETNIIDVKNHVQKAFIVNSERLTKRFYDEFKKQHKAFEGFIEGIPDDNDRRWYASIMLDRLMFCYFIQKKGFLDTNKNYLQDKLKQVREHEGDDEFFAFYRDFLCQLFHNGLNAPHHDTNDFLLKFGRIPYLNGGMFDVHFLEHKYSDIQIKDDAFAHLFAFFDQWEWHLDTRMSSSGRDINPDVLGYIFERFINDRAQMGAYYTQEDITGYIGRNCILPFLFDKMKAKMPQLFVKGGKVWKFLQQSGEMYVYESVKKGYSDDWRNRLPENIAIGLDTSKPDLLERRKHWNDKTPEEFALPTEIWRETIERFQRCEKILKLIANGEIVNINDFITYNLNIRSFTYDILDKIDDHKFIRHFYHALQRITILDPTCGSGAFLFAAMNILEPLYEVCIMRMQEFNAQNPNLFKDELAEISNKYRSNIQYFIYKSIILRNLYGVDIMAEAIEIAKLRLFLKMVAVVDVDLRADNLGLDPLPDIDFNIRCGNTLVGYATEDQLEKSFLNDADIYAKKEFEGSINIKLDIISKTYETFKWLQINQQDDRKAFNEAKKQLNQELTSLNDELNHLLYKQTATIDYNVWLANTQPLHWLAEFYGIMHNGGFDVIIGNPPYVEYNKKDSKTHKAVSDLYKIIGYKTESCGNLYAFVLERCLTIGDYLGRTGYIVPISSVSNDKFSPLFKGLIKHTRSWLSSYSNRPGKLFENVEQRLTIIVSEKCNNQREDYYSSDYNHWYVEERPVLFDGLSYCLNKRWNKELALYKIGTSIEEDIIKKIYDNNVTMGRYFTGDYYCYYHNAPTYFVRAMPFKPNNGDNMKESSHYKPIASSFNGVKTIACILNSSIFYWFYKNVSNCRDFSLREISKFPIGKMDAINVIGLSVKLVESYNRNKSIKSRIYPSGKVFYEEYYPAKSKSIIDEIDKVLAKHYGFTDEELDFIINYDIKYRMGDELGNE